MKLFHGNEPDCGHICCEMRDNPVHAHAQRTDECGSCERKRDLERERLERERLSEKVKAMVIVPGDRGS